MSTITGAMIVTAIGVGATTATTVYATHRAGEAADAQAGASEHATDVASQASDRATAAQIAAEDRATQAQTDASDKALAFEQQVYRDRSGALQQFINAGVGAVGTQARLLGITPQPAKGPTQPVAPFDQIDGSTPSAAAQADAPAPASAPVGQLVTVEAPDGSRKQVTPEEATAYQKLYGLKVVS